MSELKKYYENLLLWEKIQKEFPAWDGSVCIKQAKEKIRKEHKRIKSMKDPYIVNRFRCSYDSYIEKIVIPITKANKNVSLADAEWFFNEFYHIESPHSIYDCTGKPFTYWHSIFKLSDKVVIYHCVAFDV